MRNRWMVGLTVALLALARSGNATSADLSLSASTGTAAITLGSSQTYYLTVSNAGPAMATGVIVSNQIPANFTVSSVSAGQVFISSGILTVNLGSLPAGESVTFSLTAQPTGQFTAPASTVNPVDLVRAELTNTFSVLANETDSNPANNSASTITEMDSVFPGSPDSDYDVETLYLSPSNRINLGFQYTPNDSVTAYVQEGDYSIPTVLLDILVFYSGAPGDVVFLAGTNASLSATTARTNWLAVVRFSNPFDPTGTLGYQATQDQAFFPSNSLDADGFTNFTLFPNVIYLTGSETDIDGYITVSAYFDEAAVGYFGELDYYDAYLSASHVPQGVRLGASATPEPVVVNSNLVYSLTVSNTMARLATGVVLSNQIPAGVTFVSATGGTVSTNNGVLLVQIGSLAPGTTTPVQAVVTPTVLVSQLTNVFRVFCNQPDPDTNGGYATVISTINSATPNTSDLSLTVTPGGNPLYEGANQAYYIAVKNLGPSTATSVVLSNPIPANETFVSVTGGATPVNGVLLVNLGTLPSGATTNIEIIAFPTVPPGQAAFQLTNQFQVSASQTDPLLLNNSATVVITVNLPIPGTPLTITGNNPGGSTVVTYNIVFGSGPIEGGAAGVFTTVTATPGDLVLLTDPTGGNNPTNWAAVVRYFNPLDPTGSNALAATESEAFFATNFGGNGFDGFQLFSNADFIPAGTISTTNGVTVITATDQEFGPAGIFGVQFNLNILTVTSPYTDLSLIASAAPLPATVGSNLVYSVTVSNAGPVTATGVVVSNAIPANCMFISATGGATPTNGVLLINLGSLAGGTNTSVQVVVQPTLAGGLTNNFQVFANEFDPNVTNNSASVASTVNAGVVALADLSLTASGSPALVMVGSNLVYSLTVSNAGPAMATGVAIGNQLPANVHFDYATGVAAVTSIKGALKLNLAPLAAGANQLVQITMQPNAAGSLTNQFQVSAAQADPLLTNNSATVVSTVTNATVVSQPIPGTPVSIIGSVPIGGGSVFVSGVFAFGIGPVEVGVGGGFTATSVTPGDIILLNNPAGGNNPTNWAAVVRLFNPSDPTGSNGLAATYSQAFFATNFGGSGFAGLQLFPNTYFLPTNTIVTTNGVTTIVNTYTEFGPAGVIPPGVLDIVVLTATGPYTDLSLSASVTPEPVTVGSNLVYSITVTNAFTSLAPQTVNATGVVVSNRIPANCTFVSATGGATPTNGVLLVNLGSLAEGTNILVQVVVQPTTAGSLTNTFQIFANEFDPNVTNNSAAVVSTVTNVPVVSQPIPGTPNSASWNTGNTGGSIIAIGYISVVGNVSSITTHLQEIFQTVGAVTTVPGDVVMLLNPSGGNNPTNWAAILRFFNPADPTGTNGLAATDYEGFLPANTGSNGFAGFALFPDTSYIPVTITNADGSGDGVAGAYTEFGPAGGPAGGIIAAQTAVFVFTVLPQTTTVTITSPVAGQQVSNTVFTVTGTTTISNDVLLPAVTNVFVQLNGGSWTSATTANGWSNWSANVTLMPGSNTVQAYDVDNSGNVSATNPVTFDYVPSVPVSADLSLTVTESPNPVNVATSNLLTYTITVSNAGPATATDVTVSNQIFTQSSGIVFNSATGGSTPTNGILLMNLGSLAPGATNVAQMTAFLVRGGPASYYTNIFQVYADQTDPQPTNNFATAIFQGTGANTTQFTTSTAEYDSNTTTTVSQQLTNYTTELIAKKPDGTVVYDQKFTAAFSDPTVQAAITTAAANLAGAGDPSYTGPVQTSFLKTTNNSSVTIPSSTNINVIVGAKTWVGPVTFPAGNFGIVTGYTFDPVVTNYAITTGGNQQSLTLTAGQTDFDTMILSLFDIFLTTTNTSIYTNSSVYIMTGIVAQADLKLTASAAPEPVGVGSNLVYFITVSNAGPATASGIVVSNHFSTNATFVSENRTGAFLNPPVSLLLVDLSPLAPGASDTFQVVARPVVAGHLTNLFQVSATQTDPVLTNNSATVISTVTNAPPPPPTQADLSLTASAAPEPVGVGSNLVYTLSVTNLGPSAASGVTISNRIPAGASFVSATGGATPSSGVLLVNLGSLATGAVTNAQITVQPTAAGKLTNLFQVFASQTDPVPTNNSAVLVSTVTNAPSGNGLVDVALCITADPNPVCVGSPLTYLLMVTNNSRTTATGVIVSNLLPCNVTLISILPSQGSAGSNTDIIKFNVGSLPNGVAVTLAIVVVPKAPGCLTDKAVASSVETDSQPANNSAQITTSVVAAPPANLVLKVLTPVSSCGNQSGIFQQQVQVHNAGPTIPSWVRVLVCGLPAKATLYNASGSINGTPYVQNNSPLGVGSNEIFLLEYYVSNHKAPTNLTFTAQAGPPAPPPAGCVTNCNFCQMQRHPDGCMQMGFNAVPGRMYVIQYSSDLVTWQTATPAICATTSCVQWTDSGPPLTCSSPAQQSARYYRVVLLPAN